MRYRVKKPKLATVHQLPVISRIQRLGATRRVISIDLTGPLTREGIAQEVYKLTNAWSYWIRFDGDVAEVCAMIEPIYVFSGSYTFVVPNLPSVVERLMMVVDDDP